MSQSIKSREMKQNNPTSEFYNLFVHLYSFYNRELFGDSLDMPIIVVTRKKNVFGHYSYQRWRDSSSNAVDEIAVNPLMFNKYPITEICQTIVHEMCHQWQYQYGTPTKTGYHNTEWSEKMQSIGLMPSSTGKPGGAVIGQKMSDYPIPDADFIVQTERLISTEIFTKLYYENLNVDQDDTQIVHVHYPLEEEENIDADEYTEVEFHDDDTTVHDNSSDDFYQFLDRGEEEKPPKKSKPKCMDREYLLQQNEKKAKIKYTCNICDTNVWGKPELSIICGSCKSKYVPQTKNEQNDTN